MAKDYRQKKSRLKKIEERKSAKQAILFIFLTICLIIFLIFLGIPSLIKLVVFLGDIKISDQTPETTDTIAPLKPILNSMPEATNSAQIKISGFSEEGATIKLNLNGIDAKEVVADKEGAFIFDGVKLKKGENEIKIMAIDGAGNKSDFSQTLLITQDNEVPVLEITAPENNKEFFEDEREINITGTSEENIKILINNRLAFADSEGNFSLKYELKEGKNQIIVKALDKAGNESKEELEVTYTP